MTASTFGFATTESVSSLLVGTAGGSLTFVGACAIGGGGAAGAGPGARWGAGGAARVPPRGRVWGGPPRAVEGRARGCAGGGVGPHPRGSSGTSRKRGSRTVTT